MKIPFSCLCNLVWISPCRNEFSNGFETIIFWIQVFWFLKSALLPNHRCIKSKTIVTNQNLILKLFQPYNEFLEYSFCLLLPEMLYTTNHKISKENSCKLLSLPIKWDIKVWHATWKRHMGRLRTAALWILGCNSKYDTGAYHTAYDMRHMRSIRRTFYQFSWFHCILLLLNSFFLWKYKRIKHIIALKNKWFKNNSWSPSDFFFFWK